MKNYIVLIYKDDLETIEQNYLFYNAENELYLKEQVLKDLNIAINVDGSYKIDKHKHTNCYVDKYGSYVLINYIEYQDDEQIKKML